MVSGDEFRATTGTFATGVTVVTTNDAGDDHGMTVNSFASVSIDPPLVLMSADKETTSHDRIQSADHYAVNVLTADQEWISNRFAGEHHEMDDPFEDIPVVRAETGAPIFEECLAFLDCALWAAYEGGDHTIYVGEVTALDVRRPDADPLTFYRGEYGTVD